MTNRWLMIADAHLTCREPEDGFFRMLDDISRLPGDIGIVFLGDIFHLWIALRGYENEEHLRFLEWCRREKAKRQVIFLEGNHELFVARNYQDAFSYCGDSYQDGNLLWVHGDRINRKDHSYAVLRFILRNRLMRWILWGIGPSFGPALAHHVLDRLRTMNKAHKVSFPETCALEYLSSCPSGSIVFSGHFHDRLTKTTDGRILEVLPAYANAAELAYYDTATPGPVILPADRIAEICGKPEKQETAES